MNKESISAYPLTWPHGWPRSNKRVSSLFKTTITAALKNVRNSLIAFGKDSGTATENIVISSNVTLGNEKPKDTGVSVWFVWEKKQLCIPVDKYEKVEDNLQAIYHIIESRRTELRHGGLHILRQAFTGFKALPEQTGGAAWWDVLQCRPDASEETIKAQYKRLVMDYHPDKNNGDSSKFIILQQAYKQALSK